MKKYIRFIWRTLFSFEAVFVLFLFSGSFKSAPYIQAIFPIDPTLIFFSLSVLIGAFILFYKGLKVPKYSLQVLLTFIIFAIYSIITLLWSPSLYYAHSKALFIFTTVFWSIAASSLIIATDYVRVKKLFIHIFLMSCWQAIESLKAYIEKGGEGFVTVMGGSYLGTGQIIGFGSLIILLFIFYSKQKKLLKLVAYPIFGFFMFILLILGGRGPLLATLIGIIFSLYYSIKIEKKKSTIKIKSYALTVMLLLSGGIVYIIYLIQSGQATQTILRLVMLLDGSDQSSAGTRALYYGITLHYWEEMPIFGHGLGSWPILYSGLDDRDYPHNLFLEVLAELGLVGFFLLCFLLISGLKHLLRNGFISKHPFMITIVLLFINTFVNVQVSGDIPDNRTFFCILGLLPFIGNQFQKERSRCHEEEEPESMHSQQRSFY